MPATNDQRRSWQRRDAYPHGIIHERFGSRSIFGVETGHMMDIKKASSIYDGASNWSAGWGVLENQDGNVEPISVTISKSGEVTLIPSRWKERISASSRS
jgi:hypothetical protein